MHRDLDTAEALRRLTTIDDSPAAMDRRSFLRAAALAGSAAALAACAQPLKSPEGSAPSSTVAGERPAAPGLLLLVQLAGGNDGLNTVVPHHGPLAAPYRSMRGPLAIASPLDAGGDFGYHPSLAWLAAQHRAGRVAAVHGVGYPNPSLSHFDSIATWMAGSARPGPPSSGWIGRWLDGAPGDGAFDVVSVGSGVPLHLVGRSRRASAVTPGGSDIGTSNQPPDRRLYAAVDRLAAPSGRGALADKATAATSTMLRINRTTAPLHTTPSALPEPELSAKAVLAARLFNAGIGVRVISVTQGDYDQHDEQLGTHAANLAALDGALRAFSTELSPALARRTAVMTFSEFGRKPHPNGSRGTDHGTASCVLLVGDRVHGGFHGQHPSLSGLRTGDDLAHTVDFRSVYATVLERWLDADADELLGGRYGRLPLFTGGPTT